ncbi:MAG: sugar nucleotide-binding protein [Kiritimatiellae bacterium]|nr:sugar nucleotide-binding protein [Kiritimatiellia bacterium]
MTWLITGLGGTLGPVLKARLEGQGISVAGWDRTSHPPDNPEAARRRVEEVSPDVIAHLALGDPAWAGQLARLARERGCVMLYTSSVSVFGGRQRGPFSIQDRPEPEDDYGRYKLQCEDRILAANPAARVARIGWQIGMRPGGNHMVDFLAREMAAKGHIDASRRWFQACSFLEDTADTLITLARSGGGGVHHLDGNPGLSFLEIVQGLKHILRAEWAIRSNDVPDLDNRLRDDRARVKSITDRPGWPRPA